MSLHIKPVNAGAPGFYIKDMEDRQPQCSKIFSDQRRHAVKGKRNKINYLVCNNEATLLWMINLGCIDINPWNSRISAPEHPDFIAIDLDPSDDDPVSDSPKLLRPQWHARNISIRKSYRLLSKLQVKREFIFLFHVPASIIRSAEAWRRKFVVIFRRSFREYQQQKTAFLPGVEKCIWILPKMTMRIRSRAFTPSGLTVSPRFLRRLNGKN